MSDAFGKTLTGGTHMTLTLPYPPSANRYWRSFRGRVVKSQEARDYQQAVICLAPVGASNGPPTLLTGAVGLELNFYRPQRRGDLDNRIKVLVDALQGTLYSDDKQVSELHAYLHDDKQNPRVEVNVWATGEA
jgi:crossover junction endodeoxyribonuclease RusA